MAQQKERPTPPGCNWSAPLMRAWIDKQTQVPQQRRDAMWKLYVDWCTEKRHVTAATDKPKADEADLVIVSKLADRESGKPWVRIWAIRKRDASFYSASMELGTDKLQAMTPLQLGHDFLSQEGFYARKGRYEYDYSPKFVRREIIADNASSHRDALLLKLRQKASKGPKKKNDYFGWGEHKNYGELADALHAEESRRIRGALHQFIRGMNQEALKLMFNARTSEGWTYQWLNGAQEGLSSKKLPVATQDQQASRLQAFKVAPALIFLFRRDRKLTADIDAKRPLIASAQAALNQRRWVSFAKKPPVSAECISHIFGKRPKDVDPNYSWQLPMMGNDKYANELDGDLCFFSTLPYDWRPRTPEQYPHIGRLEYGLNKWQELTGRSNAELIRDFAVLAGSLSQFPKIPVLSKAVGAEHIIDYYALKAAAQRVGEAGKIKKLVTRTLPKGRITPEFLAALGKNHYSRGGLTGINHEYKDFFRRLGMQVVLPAIIQTYNRHGVDWVEALGENFAPELEDNGNLASRMTRKIFHGTTVPQFHHANARWHKNVTHMENNIGRYNEPSEWPALFTPQRAPNGVTFRCLTSSDELAQEGKDLDHCVSGYSYQCTFERWHIMSVCDLPPENVASMR